MKSNIFASVLLSMVLVSCNWIGKSIHGDGNIVTENRKVNKAEKIVLKGNFDVVLVPGNTTSVSIETDENLQKYILLSESNDELENPVSLDETLEQELAGTPSNGPEASAPVKAEKHDSANPWTMEIYEGDQVRLETIELPMTPEAPAAGGWNMWDLLKTKTN